MATGLYRYYDGLPTWAKAVVIVAMVLVLFIIIFWIKKLIKQAEEKRKQAEKDQEYIKDFQKYCSGKANAGQSSYPATSFIQMAAAIDQAGCEEDNFTCGGTDEEAIKSVFSKMNTVCDVLQLVQAFSERTAKSHNANTFVNTLLPTSWTGYQLPKYPLGAWLRIEMDDAEIQKYVNDVLKAKGISYSF